MKNIILNSLKESIKSIWKNKLLFFLLFILQILFFVILFYLSIIYQTKILDNAKAINDYISQLKLDDLSVASNMMQQKSILGDDPLTISRNFNEMVKNFKIYLMYLFILLVLSTSLSWAITFRLIHVKTFLPSAKMFLKIFIVLLFYLGLIFSFFYSLFNISLTQFAIQGSDLYIKYVPFLIISIILIYFMFISLSILHNTELKNIVQKTLKIGIKKGHYILTIYIINVSLSVISLISLFYLFEKRIMALPLILFIFSFVFGRIFMVKVVEKIT